MENYVQLFDQLNTLNAGEVLTSLQIQDLGLQKYSATADKVVYIVPSHLKTTPHIVHTTGSGSITFIQLTIPSEREQTIASKVSGYGIPEIETGKSKSEILRGYPSNGYNFIFNSYTNTYTKIQKVVPTSTDSYMGEIGYNYVPQTSVSPQSTSKLSTTSQKNLYSWVILFIAIVIVIIWIYRKVRLHKRSY